MFLHVKSILAVKPYTLRLEFTDGAVKEVDLSSELYGEVFEPLKAPEFFAMVRLNEETGTVEWPNGADLAPEFLHQIGVEVKEFLGTGRP